MLNQHIVYEIFVTAEVIKNKSKLIIVILKERQGVHGF